jgi:hypothetical protein
MKDGYQVATSANEIGHLGGRHGVQSSSAPEAPTYGAHPAPLRVRPAWRLLQRWNADVTHGGPCFKEHCDLAITIRHPFFMTAWDARPFYPILNAYRRLGGRRGVAIAKIRVRNEFVWAKDYLFGFDVATFRDADGRRITYFAGSFMSTIPRVNPWRLMWSHLREKAEFEISLRHKYGACVAVSFSPYANTEEIRRLSAFNFSCLTTWHPCRYLQDVTPAAFSELQKKPPESRWEAAACDFTAVRIVSRDTENAAIFDVIANRNDPRHSGDANRMLTVRLVRRLKRALFWSPGEQGELELYGDSPPLPPVKLQNNVRPGDRVIVLFARSGERSPLPTVGAETCGVIPYSKGNLQVVQEGAVDDERIEPLVEYDPGYQPRTGSDMPGPPPPPGSFFGGHPTQ